MNQFRTQISSLSLQPTISCSWRRSNQGSLIIVFVSLLSLLLLTTQLDWHRLLPAILQWTQPTELTHLLAQSGGWGPAIYVMVIMLSVVISQIPGAPLAVVAGAIWDPFWAGVYTIAGGFGGALIAYGLGKLIGPSLIKTLTGKTFSLSTDHGTTYLGWLIFASRLLPILSFDLVSYGAGMARLSFPVYACATFFGMIPSTLLLTYMGDNFQLSGGAIAPLIVIFLGIFLGLPLLLNRWNGLQINSFITLRED